MSKPIIPFVETMVAQACNLSCEGCTNYSDYNTRGYISWQQGKDWIQNWLTRVDIPDFGLIGGEPLLNPEITQWITGCRDLMPSSQIRFTTNAVILHKHLDILDTMLDIGNCVFKISVHEPNEFYIQQSLQYVFSRVAWNPIEEHGIKRWIGPNNVRFQINYPQFFWKTFRGSYASMIPYHSNPNEAFEICVQKTCPLLWQGRLFKCSSIALLPQVLDDWPQDRTAWNPYLHYQGLSTQCTDTELQQWLNGFGKPEWICQMCPTKQDTQSKINHFDNVIKKIDWIKKSVPHTS